jgi:hypothetical protein
MISCRNDPPCSAGRIKADMNYHDFTSPGVGDALLFATAGTYAPREWFYKIIHLFTPPLPKALRMHITFMTYSQS